MEETVSHIVDHSAPPPDRRIRPSMKDMLNPAKRDIVVAAYKAAGLGGERYGVVCKACGKRVCLQSKYLAEANPKEYCLCEENYVGALAVVNLDDVMSAHGLAPRDLKIRVNMTEATVKQKKRKGKRRVHNLGGKTIGDVAASLLPQIDQGLGQL